MTRSIFYLFIVLFLFGCHTSNEKDISFFKDYDFNSGDYKLYGILSEGGNTKFTESVGDFIIDDKTVLNQIKTEWQIHLTDKRMSCGYSYLIVLMKGDSCVNHFGVNLDCEYLSCDKGWFDFPANLLNKYEDSVKKIPRDSAIAFHDTLINRHTFDK